MHFYFLNWIECSYSAVVHSALLFLPFSTVVSSLGLAKQPIMDELTQESSLVRDIASFNFVMASEPKFQNSSPSLFVKRQMKFWRQILRPLRLRTMHCSLPIMASLFSSWAFGPPHTQFQHGLRKIGSP